MTLESQGIHFRIIRRLCRDSTSKMIIPIPLAWGAIIKRPKESIAQNQREIIHLLGPLNYLRHNIVPLLKSEDPMIFSNYRPVSVLPVFIRRFTKELCIIKFSNDFDIHVSYDFHFGFRIGHSPNIALIYLIDKMIDSLNGGKVVIGLFLDFKKASDMVKHEIILFKLYHNGIRCVVTNGSEVIKIIEYSMWNVRAQSQSSMISLVESHKGWS